MTNKPSPSLTLFSIPKPFIDDSERIQRNALFSWLQMGNVQIVLVGDDQGIEGVARQYQVEHIPDVACNEFGTPFLNSAFKLVKAKAEAPVLCYTNADIIFLGSLPEIIEQVPCKQFLMIGRRTNLAVDWHLEDTEGWLGRLRRETVNHGELDIPYALDYFVFPADSPLCELPPFVVGRPYWDNWLVFRARQLGIPVIDATCAIQAVHQAHGYGHVPVRSGPRWEGPEADWNRQCFGEVKDVLTICDATYLMQGSKLRRALRPPYLFRRWRVLGVLHPRMWGLVRLVERLVGRLVRMLGVFPGVKSRLDAWRCH